MGITTYTMQAYLHEVGEIPFTKGFFQSFLLYSTSCRMSLVFALINYCGFVSRAVSSLSRPSSLVECCSLLFDFISTHLTCVLRKQRNSSTMVSLQNFKVHTNQTKNAKGREFIKLLQPCLQRQSLRMQVD
jgi:hypothetical protein